MARAYSVVAIVTAALCAALAEAFDIGDHHLSEPRVMAELIAGLLILLGLAILLSRGPLRRDFELLGLGPGDRSFRGRAGAFLGSFVGIFGSWTMRIVLGPRPGFLPMFAWLTLMLTAFTAVYVLLARRRRNPAGVSVQAGSRGEREIASPPVDYPLLLRHHDGPTFNANHGRAEFDRVRTGRGDKRRDFSGHGSPVGIDAVAAVLGDGARARQLRPEGILARPGQILKRPSSRSRRVLDLARSPCS